MQVCDLSRFNALGNQVSEQFMEQFKETDKQATLVFSSLTCSRLEPLIGCQAPRMQGPV